MLDHQPDAIRHAQKSRIVGMDAVHGEIVGVGDHTEAEAVHEVDVLVPVLPRLQVGVHDHLTAAEDVVLTAGLCPEVGTSDHDVGEVGVLLADDLVEGVMGGGQMVGGGRVVVVIADEHTHGQGRHPLGQHSLTLGLTRKSDIVEIHIQISGNDGGVDQSGSPRGGAVDDGGAVEGDGEDVAVGSRRSQLGIRMQTHLQLLHHGVDGEIDGEGAHDPRLHVHPEDRLIGVGHIVGHTELTDESAAELAVLIQVEARGGQKGQVRRPPHHTELGSDGHVDRVGGEPHPSARGFLGQKSHPLAGRVGHLGGHTTEIGLRQRLIQAVDGEGGLAHVIPVHVHVLDLGADDHVGVNVDVGFHGTPPSD